MQTTRAYLTNSMITPRAMQTAGAYLTKFDDYAPRNANYRGFTD